MGAAEGGTYDQGKTGVCGPFCAGFVTTSPPMKARGHETHTDLWSVSGVQVHGTGT